MKKLFVFLMLAIPFFSMAASHLSLNSTTGVEYLSYYFGQVQMNTTTSVTYKVTNTGTTPLVFQSAAISGIGYDAYHTCKNGLAPKATCNFEIIFWPTMPGFMTGRFDLPFEQNTEFVVDLTGDSVR